MHPRTTGVHNQSYQKSRKIEEIYIFHSPTDEQSKVILGTPFSVKKSFSVKKIFLSKKTSTLCGEDMPTYQGVSDGSLHEPDGILNTGSDIGGGGLLPRHHFTLNKVSNRLYYFVDQEIITSIVHQLEK